MPSENIICWDQQNLHTCYVSLVSDLFGLTPRVKEALQLMNFGESGSETA